MKMLRQTAADKAWSDKVDEGGTMLSAILVLIVIAVPLVLL